MDTPTKTLVIRFSSIGDVVLCRRCFAFCVHVFPTGKLTMSRGKEYAELVKSNQNLNHTYEFDATLGFDGLRALKKKIKDEGYDLIVDIHDSLRSKNLRSLRGSKRVVLNKRVLERSMLVTLKKNIYKDVVPIVDRYLETLKEFGMTNDGKGLELYIPDDVLFGVAGRIASLKLNRFENVVGICPGARHFTKRWPADRLARCRCSTGTDHGLQKCYCSVVRRMSPFVVKFARRSMRRRVRREHLLFVVSSSCLRQRQQWDTAM